MINAISIALSGLAAATKKVNAAASNIANISSAGSLDDAQNKPYTPLITQQTALSDGSGNPGGVRSDYTAKANPFVATYQPDSPFANAEGLIGLPNVDLAEEAINLQIASASYKASVSVLKTQEDMTSEMLRLFDKKA
jgi:flagellar basal-body rod protein FlgC